VETLQDKYAQLTDTLARSPLANDPQADQMLAAMREALDAIEDFRSLPVWRFWQVRSRYRHMAEACSRAGFERERFSALIREIESA
jgi:hypothetical protein